MGRAAADLDPLLALTLGDVAGVGPEILVRAWEEHAIHEFCRPVVIGNRKLLEREIARFRLQLAVQTIVRIEDASSDPKTISCIESGPPEVAELPLGRVHAEAGRAAFDYLVLAIDFATSGVVDGIVTLPLNKEGLHAAGLHYPGHTEILAERTGVQNFAMMLYRKGLGVLHVTLHMALRDVFANLSTERIAEKIGLLDQMMRRLQSGEPRLAVAALNPHASDGGIFGDEEEAIIAPAVEKAKAKGINVIGPLPTDTLFVRAKNGEFDGIVAMYHDQGHIALKLLGWKEAVNITVGLPIVRTSVAHGTAYDIVGTGKADPASLIEAIRVAAKLCRR